MKYTVTRTTKRFVNGVLVEDTTVIDEADTPEQLPTREDPHVEELLRDANHFFDRVSEWLKNMPRFRSRC